MSEFKKIVESFMTENYSLDKKIIEAGNLYWFNFLNDLNEYFLNKENIYLPNGSCKLRISENFDGVDLILDIAVMLNGTQRNRRSYLDLNDTENNGIPIIGINVYNIIDFNNISRKGNANEGDNSIILKKDDFMSILQDFHVVDSFVHELRHLIDLKKDFFNKDKYTKADFNSYSNQAFEVDAKTVELLNDILSEMMNEYDMSYNEIDRDEKLKYIRDKLFKNSYFVYFYNNLDVNNKKRVLKRIYSFVDNVDSMFTDKL